MSTYLVFGAGQMGTLIAYDLAMQESTKNVHVVDKDPARAQAAANTAGGKAVAHCASFGDKKLDDLLADSDVLVSAAHYKFNHDILPRVMNAGTHMVDLGGNPDIVRLQESMHAYAEKAGITIIPNCGLAPGLANIVGAEAITRLGSKADRVMLRVGGLPQKPEGPLNYMLVFSVSGLINEYKEPADILKCGKIIRVPSLCDVENLRVAGIDLEAFNTAGGTGTMCDTFAKSVDHLDYKTIRFPGHCEKMKLLFDLGFFEEGSVRDMNEAVLEKAVNKQGHDMTLMRVEAARKNNATTLSVSYEMKDLHDGIWTSMQRTTGYPVSIIAQMVAGGSISRRGVLRCETDVPYAPLIAELAARGIVIRENVQFRSA